MQNLFTSTRFQAPLRQGADSPTLSTAGNCFRSVGPRLQGRGHSTPWARGLLLPRRKWPLKEILPADPALQDSCYPGKREVPPGSQLHSGRAPPGPQARPLLWTRKAGLCWPGEVDFPCAGRPGTRGRGGRGRHSSISQAPGVCVWGVSIGLPSWGCTSTLSAIVWTTESWVCPLFSSQPWGWRPTSFTVEESGPQRSEVTRPGHRAGGWQSCS